MNFDKEEIVTCLQLSFQIDHCFENVKELIREMYNYLKGHPELSPSDYDDLKFLYERLNFNSQKIFELRQEIADSLHVINADTRNPATVLNAILSDLESSAEDDERMRFWLYVQNPEFKDVGLLIINDIADKIQASLDAHKKIVKKIKKFRDDMKVLDQENVPVDDNIVQ